MNLKELSVKYTFGLNIFILFPSLFLCGILEIVCGSVQKIWGYQIFTKIMCHADILGPGYLSSFDTFLIVLHKFRKCLIWSMHAALAGLKWGAAGTTSAPLPSSDAESAPKTPSSAVRTY